jgi:hypothetical protein
MIHGPFVSICLTNLFFLFKLSHSRVFESILLKGPLVLLYQTIYFLFSLFFMHFLGFLPFFAGIHPE